MKLLIEKRNELEAKNKKLAQVFEEAGPEMDMDKVDCLEGCKTSREKAKRIEEMNNELTDIGKEVSRLAEIEKAAEDTKKRQEELTKANRIALPGAGAGTPPGQITPVKSIGQMFVESKAYKNREHKAEAELDIELKTLFETTVGWAPEVLRTGKVVEFATRPIQVIDVFPAGATGQNSIKYMEETTFTNAAAEAAEGGSYAEGALKLTEKSSPVEKIATFLPITDEQLEDVARVSSYIDNRLRFMLMQRLDLQLLVGNGAAPNLRGVLNVVDIQTIAKGGDSEPAAIRKAMTKVRVTGRANPSSVIIHPNDWETIILLTTADGVFIWGHPSAAGPERIWGLPIVQTDAETENTTLVGDFLVHSELVTRRGIIVKISDSHSTYFVEGKQAIRADVRVAIIIYRPKAYCTVTGM